VKRPSYLAQLADGVKGQPALRPPPVIFRPTDAASFVESVNEPGPARGTVAQSGPDSDGAPRSTAAAPAVAPLRIDRSGNASSARVPAAGPRESPVSLSPTRVTAESRESVPARDRNEQPRAAVPPSTPPAVTSASQTPLSKLLPKDPPATRDDSRPREKPAPPATLSPKAPNDRAPASSVLGDRKNSHEDGGVSVRIGTLEVRINPAPPPAPQKPAAAPRAPLQSRKESLARGFGSFGMVQG
jgi:hypothetical protein